jgi:RNA polymerase sigma-70 factor (ECF subfamily)
LNETEITEAFRRYGHLVLRRCQQILRTPAAAEDAQQEVFLRLWRYGDSFRAAESKVAWLYRVADRCAYDQLHRGRIPEVESPSGGLGCDTSAPPSQPMEDAQIVMRFLGRLDDRLRQVAVLHYLDERTQEEIATATGWSRQTIIKKLAFLREEAARLKRQLGEQ